MGEEEREPEDEEGEQDRLGGAGDEPGAEDRRRGRGRPAVRLKIPKSLSKITFAPMNRFAVTATNPTIPAAKYE